MKHADWLLQDTTGQRRLRIARRMAISDATGKIAIERIEVDDGLQLFLIDADMHAEVTLQPHDTGDGVWLQGGIAVTGGIATELPDGLRAPVDAGQALLFRCAGGHARYRLPAGQTLRLIGYSLRADRVRQIFKDGLPAALTPLLEPELESSRAIGMQATRRLRRRAETLYSPGLRGPLRQLYTEGVVLQLLASQLAGQLHWLGALTPEERQAVLMAHRLLLQDIRQPPGLGALAAKVGLSEKRLTAGFRCEFGGTVFEVLRNHRMEQARIALQARGAPLKQIAWRVGYNHVTNFINAFTARYGTPPKRYAEIAMGGTGRQG